MLQEDFGDNAMSQSKTFYGTNASGTDERLSMTMSILDDCRQAQHWKTAKVREVILADHRQNIHDVCEIVGLSYGTIQCILADNLNMRHISARVVPRLLSNDQKALRVSVCRELKQQARDDPNFISNIITGDETWVYGYDPETMQHSSLVIVEFARFTATEKSASSSQQCQVHVDLFFDIQSIVHGLTTLVKPLMASFTVRFPGG